MRMLFAGAHCGCQTSDGSRPSAAFQQQLTLLWAAKVVFPMAGLCVAKTGNLLAMASSNLRTRARQPTFSRHARKANFSLRMSLVIHGISVHVIEPQGVQVSMLEALAARQQDLVEEQALP